LKRIILTIILLLIFLYVFLNGLEYVLYKFDIISTSDVTYIIFRILFTDSVLFFVAYITVKDHEFVKTYFNLKSELKEYDYLIYFLMFVLGIILYYFTVIITGYFKTILPYNNYASEESTKFTTIQYKLIYLLITGILSPLCEEIFFRGYCYGYTRQHLGILFSMLINIAIFAILHPIPAFIPSLIFASVVFCYSFEWTHSVLYPFIIHATYNCINILQYFNINI
jgi:membrane protease YdiL (CAAX protease family)